MWQSLSFIIAAFLVQLSAGADDHKNPPPPPPPPPHRPSPPVSLDLKWFVNDANGGLYIADVKVGTPPQTQTLVFDTGFSDILLNFPKDPAYQQACQSQTPVSLCVTFDNTTSSTFHGFGAGTYEHLNDQPHAFGEYITDTLEIAPLSIKGQTMAYTTNSSEAFALFGLGPPQEQDGIRTGTFHQYPSAIESLVNQGTYEAAAFSLYLDPRLGPGDSIETFPPGTITFGGIDTSLFQGPLVTLPTVADNSTAVVKKPEHWNLAISKLSLAGTKKNLLNKPAQCTIASGGNVLFLPGDIFTNLVAQFPDAKLNQSTGIYEVPCEERQDPRNKASFTFVDPRSPFGSNEFTVEIPSSEVIWTADRIVGPGTDPRTCGIAAFNVDEFPGLGCSLGASLMKSVFWVFDLTNAEISVALAVPRGSKRGEVISIPKTGARGCQL